MNRSGVLYAEVVEDALPQGHKFGKAKERAVDDIDERDKVGHRPSRTPGGRRSWWGDPVEQVELQHQWDGWGRCTSAYLSHLG